MERRTQTALTVLFVIWAILFIMTMGLCIHVLSEEAEPTCPTTCEPTVTTTACESEMTSESSYKATSQETTATASSKVQEVLPTVTEPSSTVKKKNTDNEILARILTYEAGFTNRELMVAVGMVILNRMGRYDLSLRETIYEDGVFSPVSAKGYEQKEIASKAREVADWLLKGNRDSLVKDALFFCTVEHYNKRTGWHWKASHGDCPTIEEVCRIGDTVFFREVS